MFHTIHPIDGGTALRFPTWRGTVWALVLPDGNGAAGLGIYEEGAALASRGLPEVEAQRRTEFRGARGRFGTGLMLRVCREVRAAFPGVRFQYERVAGARPGREKVRL